MKAKTIVYFISFAAFLGPFTQTIYTPILPEIQDAFRTSAFWVNLSISIFTIFLAGMQMVYGPLVDTKGRRKVLLFGIVFYILASAGCYAAPNIGLLLAFRSLQAIGIAAGSVVAVTMIGDLFEGAERGRAMGTFQMMVALGPVVGPVIGGFLGGMGGFRTVFLALIAAGIVILVLNAAYTRETKPDNAGGGRVSVRDFSRVLSDPTGGSVISLGIVQYYTMYSFLVFLPEILSTTYGFGPEQKGLFFLPLSLFIVIGSFIGGRLQSRVDTRRFLHLSCWLNAASVLAFLLTARLSLIPLVLTIALFGLVLGLSLPVQTTLLTHAFRAKRATAVGTYNFFRYMGMAAGPMIGSLLDHLAGTALVFGFVVALFVLCALLVRLRLVRHPAPVQGDA